ncbi:MAG: DNA repair and recombination protein RadB [Candidatus Thermoplasmatota archaeon]
MRLLPIGCKSLDDLIGGGIESGIITKIYGEAGTGKTNICLQATRECILNNIGRVVYIDTEGVSMERLKQITNKHRYSEMLDKILLYTPTTFENQEGIITELSKITDKGLIIIDTINMLYRLQIEHDRESAMRSFIRQMTTLQLTAREQDLFIIVAEQVYTDKSGEIKPFTHRETEHMVKTIIKLERKGIGERRAVLMKHRFQPEGKNVEFHITSKGLE